MRATSLSVVIPVYNSQDTLRPLLQRLIPALRELATSFEVIFVNDGSKDKSWQTIQEVAKEHPEVRGLEMMRNYGQHNALLAGIRAARYELLITMDDDLQHPPEELLKLLDALQDNDVVYGCPQKQQHGLLRDMASAVTKLALQSAMGAEIASKISALRIFRTQLRDAFAQYNSPFVSIDVLLTWATTRFTAIQVRHDPRTIGASNYTLRKLISHAFNMITGFSALPLQLASIIGFSFTIVGVLVFLYVVGRYLIQGGSVPGFPFLASIISIFSGAQLLSLGLIGEYLARMHFRTMDKPAYVLRSRVGELIQTKEEKDGPQDPV
jgi:glycosyltransferase involved in cell wall biosynthesis